MASCTGVSGDNDGVNEFAINPFTEENNKGRVVQEVKYGHLTSKAKMEIAENIKVQRLK